MGLCVKKPTKRDSIKNRLGDYEINPVSTLMKQIAAVAKRKGLPCTVTPDEVRIESSTSKTGDGRR